MLFRSVCSLLTGWVCLSGSVLLAAPPTFQLQVTPARQIEATFTTTVHMPNSQVKQWKFFFADPPKLACQPEVTTTVKPEATPAKEVGERKRSLLVVDVTDPQDRHNIQVQLTYRATLMARRLVPLNSRQKPPAVPELTKEEREAALESTEMLDYDAAEFQKWLTAQKLRKSPRETDLAFAHRVFCDIAERGSYDYSGGLDRRPTAVCRSLKSDCAGLSALFVSVLRANDIPARILVGRLARNVDPAATLQGRDFDGQHVRTEFFADGIGWVPQDVTRALKDKSAKKLEHFGNDPGDLLVLHLDPDLTVQVWPNKQKTYHWLQGAPYFYKGQGSSEGKMSENTWQVNILEGETLSK